MSCGVMARLLLLRERERRVNQQKRNVLSEEEMVDGKPREL